MPQKQLEAGFGSPVDVTHALCSKAMQLRTIAALCSVVLLFGCGGSKDETVNSDGDDHADDTTDDDDDGGDDDEATGGAGSDDDAAMGGAGSDDDGDDDIDIVPSDDDADDDADDDTGAFATSLVGSTCEVDGDCDPGLFCLTESDYLFPGGEIAEGLCTADCTTGQGVCDSFANAAICYGGQSEAYCLEACVVGSSTVVDSGKCQARLSEVCAELPADADGQPPYGIQGLGLCYPDCFSDVLCNEGSFCNPATGLCQTEEPEGIAYGDSCEVGDDESCLGGFCLQYNDEGDGLCSGGCTFTPFVGGCGPGGGGDDPPDALCLPVYEPVQYSDPGLCIPTCDTDGDCLDGLVCSSFEDADTIAAVGREGTCVPGDSGDDDSSDDDTGMDDVDAGNETDAG